MVVLAVSRLPSSSAICYTPFYTIQLVVELVVQMVVQPVVSPVVQPVLQQVGCLYTRYNLLSNWLSDRFDNRLYRVNGALDLTFDHLIYAAYLWMCSMIFVTHQV